MFNKKSELLEITTSIGLIEEKLKNISSQITELQSDDRLDEIESRISGIENSAITQQEDFITLHEDFKMLQFSLKDPAENRLQNELEQVKQNQYHISESIRDIHLKLNNIVSRNEFDEIDTKIDIKINEILEAKTEDHVFRDEFNRLINRMEHIFGAEVIGERLDALDRIFETDNLEELSWKAKTFNLLKSGLAPEAAQDVIAANMIPKSKCQAFLKMLEEMSVVETSSITSYHLLPEYEWIYNYTNDITRLRDRIKIVKTKSHEYHEFVGENLRLVGDDLAVIDEYVSIGEFLIDYLCETSQGQVGVVIAYPTARNYTRFMVSDYYRVKEPNMPRLIIVSPSFPKIVKEVFNKENIEYKMLQY